MKNKILITAIFISLAFNCNAQSNIPGVLHEVSKNNKTIQSHEQYWIAQKLQYKTGISLYNPTVEYDYLKGSPANAGNQTDILVSQSFDFPSSYRKKQQLANEQILQADLQLKSATQDILLEAKKICIELVYRNKLQLPLLKRKDATEKWLGNFKRRLDKGDGNILDVNKSELQLIDVKKQFRENASEIASLTERLTALNGGNAIVFSDTVYSEMPIIPKFETLEADFEANDPMLKVMQQEKVVAQKQLEVAKSLTLPKMEIGYHYQGILGQTYHGVHTGLTLPLWESKNTVKLQKAKIDYAETELANHKNGHFYEIKVLYGRYENLKLILADYNNKINAVENIRLLDKALAYGQISALDYFMEVNYYNTLFNSYLETEKDYHETIAELYKYQL